MIVGLGTLLNIATIVVGAAIGVLIGNRLPERTNRVVTDALGLITIVLGGLNLVALSDPDFVGAVGAAGTSEAFFAEPLPFANHGCTGLSKPSDSGTTGSGACLNSALPVSNP